MSKEAKNFIEMMKVGVLPPIKSAENCKGLTKVEGEQRDRRTDNRFVNQIVYCIDCKYFMFSDCYGECSKGNLGILSPYDFCSRGVKKELYNE